MAIVIYFSRAGENHVNGKKEHLSIGQTTHAAKKIAEKVNGTLAELVPITQYPVSYDEMVGLAQKEKQEQARPLYETLTVDFSKETDIFLGYPNWWGTFPMIVATFLEANDLSGKRIYPFCTHEGSALGSSIEDLKRLCPTSVIKEGLAIRGSCTVKADKAIDNWLVQYRCNSCKN